MKLTRKAIKLMQARKEVRREYVKMLRVICRLTGFDRVPYDPRKIALEKCCEIVSLKYGIEKNYLVDRCDTPNLIIIGSNAEPVT